MGAGWCHRKPPASLRRLVNSVFGSESSASPIGRFPVRHLLLDITPSQPLSRGQRLLRGGRQSWAVSFIRHPACRGGTVSGCGMGSRDRGWRRNSIDFSSRRGGEGCRVDPLDRGTGGRVGRLPRRVGRDLPLVSSPGCQVLLAQPVVNVGQVLPEHRAVGPHLHGVPQHLGASCH